MYADAQVNRLLEVLDALGLRRNTVIVYLSDHGESLGDHAEPTHGVFLYGSTLDVPMIISLPPSRTVGSPVLDLAGRRARGLARLVDVTPTVLDLVGLPVPAGLDGISLLSMVAHESDSDSDSPSADKPDALAGPVSYAETFYPRFHYNWSELVVLQTSRWKFVRAPRPELYDLQQDPRELRDVLAEHPNIGATLAKHLDSMSLLKAGVEPTPAKLTADESARLQALGYVSAQPLRTRRTGPPADPKDRLPLLQELPYRPAIRAPQTKNAGETRGPAGVAYR
jgi:choline-sulfatase